MSMSPIDIQQKTFGPELRGYNMDEVDDFLDEVVTTLKEYDQKVRDAQDRIRALESETSTHGDDVSAIGRALVAAQEQADQILASARTEADRLQVEANSETERLMAERDSERKALTQEVARMRATVADLKRRVVDLAAAANSDLDAMDAAAASVSAELATDDEMAGAGSADPVAEEWEDNDGGAVDTTDDVLDDDVEDDDVVEDDDGEEIDPFGEYEVKPAADADTADPDLSDDVSGRRPWERG